LAGDWHIPKGMIFVIGIWSMMFASGIPFVTTLLAGSTTSELGAMPNVHRIIAPIQTCMGIIHSPGTSSCSACSALLSIRRRFSAGLIDSKAASQKGFRGPHEETPAVSLVTGRACAGLYVTRAL
jgi:hypothetical protein